MSKRRGESQRTKQKVVRETHKTNNSSLTRRWLYEESNDALPGRRRPTIINQPTSPRRPSARSRDMKATRPQQKPQRTKQKVVRETHKTNNSFLTRQWLYEESNDTLPGCDGRRSSINRRHRDALPRVRYIWTTEPTVLDTQVRMETVKNGARHETFNITGEPSRKTTKKVARWVLP